MTTLPTECRSRAIWNGPQGTVAPEGRFDGREHVLAWLQGLESREGRCARAERVKPNPPSLPLPSAVGDFDVRCQGNWPFLLDFPLSFFSESPPECPGVDRYCVPGEGLPPRCIPARGLPLPSGRQAAITSLGRESIRGFQPLPRA